MGQKKRKLTHFGQGNQSRVSVTVAGGGWIVAFVVKVMVMVRKLESQWVCRDDRKRSPRNFLSSDSCWDYWLNFTVAAWCNSLQHKASNIDCPTSSLCRNRIPISYLTVQGQLDILEWLAYGLEDETYATHLSFLKFNESIVAYTVEIRLEFISITEISTKKNEMSVLTQCRFLF